MKDKNKATEKLGDLADKVVKGADVKLTYKGKNNVDRNTEIGAFGIESEVVKGSEVGFSDKLKSKEFLEGNEVLSFSISSEQEEKAMAIMDAGERITEFAKQRGTDVDNVISWLLDHFQKESTLGKKSKIEKIAEPVEKTIQSGSWADQQRKRKCGF